VTGLTELMAIGRRRYDEAMASLSAASQAADLGPEAREHLLRALALLSRKKQPAGLEPQRKGES